MTLAAYVLLVMNAGRMDVVYFENKARCEAAVAAITQSVAQPGRTMLCLPTKANP